MNEKQYYPLTPAQEMIYLMLKYSFFHKQVTQIPASIIVKRKIDFDLLKKALDIEVERNDCLRMSFAKKHGKPVQSFSDKAVKFDVPVLTFKTKEEQENYFNADAQIPVKYLKNEIARFRFFNSFDGRYGIYINVFHLVMDASAVFTFFSDLLAIYEHLETGAPMPAPLGSFEETVKKELAYINNPERVKKDEEWFREFYTKDGEPIWNGVQGPGPLDKVRKKKPDKKYVAAFDPIHDKAELEKKPLSPEDSKIILDFMEKNGISGECLVQLGMRLHVGKINHRHDDTYFVVLCTRRRTLAEKRSGGSMTSILPWRLILPETLTFSEALDKMKAFQGDIFRHMDFPYNNYRALEGEYFGYGPADGSSTMMFSWFPLENSTMNGWEYEFNGYNLGRYVMPLYSYSMKDASSGGLKFAYLHRTAMISKEDIDSLHDNTVKALVAGCSNPDLTLGSIMDMID
ncbi:MAG: hypothetical protein IKH65_05810 [Clostridia bacterium]|nr:hypothetical protein [Clostridia bacterium]